VSTYQYILNAGAEPAQCAVLYHITVEVATNGPPKSLLDWFLIAMMRWGLAGVKAIHLYGF
jgi:hypothetical protein